MLRTETVASNQALPLRAQYYTRKIERGGEPGRFWSCAGHGWTWFSINGRYCTRSQRESLVQGYWNRHWESTSYTVLCMVICVSMLKALSLVMNTINMWHTYIHSYTSSTVSRHLSAKTSTSLFTHASRGWQLDLRLHERYYGWYKCCESAAYCLCISVNLFFHAR